jgi:hypothetical protein
MALDVSGPMTRSSG